MRVASIRAINHWKKRLRTVSREIHNRDLYWMSSEACIVSISVFGVFASKPKISGRFLVIGRRRSFRFLFRDWFGCNLQNPETELQFPAQNSRSSEFMVDMLGRFFDNVKNVIFISGALFWGGANFKSALTSLSATHVLRALMQLICTLHCPRGCYPGLLISSARLSKRSHRINPGMSSKCII